MSWRDLIVPARQSVPGLQPAQAQAAEAEAAAAAQTPAALGTATASGADFSGVRVHTDGQAQELAESFGAKAFTYGQDVFFGPGRFAPGTAEGDELLAHELTHVGQQSQAGSPVLQCDPKGQKGGIGATPPAEDFIKDPGDWGAEDSDVLFAQDQIGIDDASMKTLSEFAAQQKQAVTVQLHGYSSKEGPDEYNLNLSAHRAVAIKHALEKLLPAGSKVFVFAHGETRHFGASEQNRRVGISLIGPVDSGFHLGLGGGLHYSLGARGQGGPYLRPPTLDLPHANLGLTGDPAPAGPRTGGTTIPLGSPPGGPTFKVDWRALNEPATAHGAQMSERDVAAFQTAGAVLYHNLYPILGPDLAQWWTNSTLVHAYQARLTLEHPTLLDLSDLDFKQHYPDAKGVPPLPLVSPETLNFVIKHTLGKDIDFHFNWP